ncbi:MAG TPA: cytochrome P450 [Vicinamibacteria bacterium]|nr:cytochrome P450 [Vicinamibacteria bacterium]
MSPIRSTTAAGANGLPPRPPGHPLWGNLSTFRGPIQDHLLAAQRAHGDVLRFEIGPKKILVVTHPDDVEHIVYDRWQSYGQGSGMEETKALLGDGLLTSSGALWRRQRSLAQPAFRKGRMCGFAGSMARCVEAMLARWEGLRLRNFDVAAEMNRLTLDIAARTLFGASLGDAEASIISESLPPLMREAVRRQFGLWAAPRWMPTPNNRRMAAHIERLNRVVYGIIDARRRRVAAGGDAGTDLLGLLMTACDEESGVGMTDKLLRDESMNLLMAGHETTAQFLSWTWYLLSLYPDARNRVEKEVDALPDGIPRGTEGLEFTRRVLDETLRIYPPAWVFRRTAMEDDVVSGYRVPAGSDVLLIPWVIHRHESFWTNPEAFDPDRFLPERSFDRHRCAYVPFGGGPRLCIGMHFALLEALIVVAMVSRRYRMDRVPGPPVTPEASFTLRPRGGLWMNALARA